MIEPPQTDDVRELKKLHVRQQIKIAELEGQLKYSAEACEIASKVEKRWREIESEKQSLQKQVERLSSENESLLAQLEDAEADVADATDRLAIAQKIAPVVLAKWWFWRRPSKAASYCFAIADEMIRQSIR